MPVHKPTIKEKLFFIFSGAVISTPFPALFNSMIGYFFTESYPLVVATFISVAVVAPVLEEFAKAYPLFYRHSETERSIFTLGFLTGLGFGIAEFLLYTLVLKIPVMTRLPLVLFHATNTSIAAYGIAKHRAFIFYLLVVFLHSANNIFSQQSRITAGIFLPILASYFLSWRLYQLTEEKTIA